MIGTACVTGGTQAVGLNLPLFAGAKLRARQTLCTTSPNSTTITVAQPEEWPLGPGPFKAGFRLVTDIPVSANITPPGGQYECDDGFYEFPLPVANKAIVFYPATAEGQDAPFAAGAPFPVIAYAHGRRKPSCFPNWDACPGAPTDTVDDFTKLSDVMSHLARWGFVSIAADFSWLAEDFTTSDWALALGDAASHLVAENGKPGSAFEGQLTTATISLMGHSTTPLGKQ